MCEQGLGFNPGLGYRKMEVTSFHSDEFILGVMRRASNSYLLNIIGTSKFTRAPTVKLARNSRIKTSLGVGVNGSKMNARGFDRVPVLLCKRPRPTPPLEKKKKLIWHRVQEQSLTRTFRKRACFHVQQYNVWRKTAWLIPMWK